MGDDEIGQCLRDARAGSRDALGRALEACHSDLRRAARFALPSRLAAKCDPDDLVQETSLAAREHIDQFAGGAAAEWRGWLRAILANNARLTVRRYRHAGKRDVSLEVAIDPADPHAGDEPLSVTGSASSPLEWLVADEQSTAIRRKLPGLPVRERAAVILRYYAGYTFGEVAGRLRCSESMARKLIVHAVARLGHDPDGVSLS